MEYRLEKCPICGSLLLKEVSSRKDNDDIYYSYHCEACDSLVEGKPLPKLELEKPVIKSNSLSPEEVFAKCIDGIFEIIVYKDTSIACVGTAFAIDKYHIATNKHIINYVKKPEGSTITYYIQKYKKKFEIIPLKLIGCSEKYDFGILKVDQPHTTLKPLKITTRQLKVGEPAYCIGNAKGDGIRMTSGIVSDIGRFDRGREILLTSAQSEKGNSGSPIIDKHGEVIAINYAIRAESSSMHYSIPSNVIVREINNILGNIKE